jgi:hypothetical protein
MIDAISALLGLIGWRKAKKRRAKPFSPDPLSHFYEMQECMRNNISGPDWPDVDVHRYRPKPPLKDRSG